MHTYAHHFMIFYVYCLQLYHIQMFQTSIIGNISIKQTRNPLLECGNVRSCRKLWEYEIMPEIVKNCHTNGNVKKS